MNEQQIPWREIIAVLHRRRLFILQVFLIGSVTAAVGVWMQQPTYRASATLMVTSDRAQIVMSPDANTRPTVERVTEQDMYGEVALIKSEALIREVLEPYWKERSAQTEEKPSFISRVMYVVTYPLRIMDLPAIIYRKIHGVPPMSPIDAWAHDMASNIGVNLVGKSNLIVVEYYSSRPAWAAEFVNKLVARHIERHTKLSQQSEARRFFESQRDVLAEKSRAAEAALYEFNRREGMEAMTREQRLAFRSRFEDLQTQLATSETELAEGTARIAFLTSEIKNYPKNIATESKIAQNQQFIKPKILELELQRSELLSKYAPGSVRVRDIDRQIAEARRLMASDRETLAETTNAINPAYQSLEVDLAQTKAQMAAVGARVEALHAQVGDHKKTVAHLDEVGSEQERLEQAVSSAKEAFFTYSKKEEEARFTTALDESSFVDLAVAEPAEVPTAPERSKKSMMVLIGSLISFVAGVGLAFVRDRLDPAVKSAAEAQSVSGLPILAEVR